MEVRVDFSNEISDSDKRPFNQVIHPENLPFQFSAILREAEDLGVAGGPLSEALLSTK
jgi:hypothetical protein